MKISRILVYPIKSFRGYEPTSAELTRHGFTHDRRFMVLHRQPDGALKNMHVAHYPDLTLMFATVNHTAGTITITYRPPLNTNKHESSIDIPLEPDVNSLQETQIEMHKSPTTAFIMEEKFNSWLSTNLGYDVLLVYLGPHFRPVLMSSAANPTPSVVPSTNTSNSSSWLSSLTSTLPASISGVLGGSTVQPQQDKITFADCAPYLIVSETSLKDVSSRISGPEQMDVTKFRPNIIVSGAEAIWEEDLWAEMEILGPRHEDEEVETKARILCVHNCARCASINIDYTTGKPGTGESGKVLKLLQKDRRIDRGMKYSPVFGRYSFIAESSEGVSIAVGDEVRITKRNEAQTVFDWPVLSTA